MVDGSWPMVRGLPALRHLPSAIRSVRWRSTFVPTLACAAFLLSVSPPATAEVEGKPVSEDAGPVSDGSRSVSHGSRPVHERGRTTHESSVGALSGNSTYESSTGPVRSGSLADITAGTVASDRSLRREKALARLVPAPPRSVWQETVDAPVEWQLVNDLDPLVEAIGAIEPMARADLETEPAGEDFVEPADDDSPVVTDE